MNEIQNKNRIVHKRLKAFGCLRKYANKDIIGKEREIIAEAIVENYLRKNNMLDGIA